LLSEYNEVDYECGVYDTTNKDDARLMLDPGSDHFPGFKKVASKQRHFSLKHEAMAANCLSMRLLQVDIDDSDAKELILQESLNIPSLHRAGAGHKILDYMEQASRQAACEQLMTMMCVCCLTLRLIVAAFWAEVEFIGPPNQPVGP
jgi:hypothetical protein